MSTAAKNLLGALLIATLCYTPIAAADDHRGRGSDHGRDWHDDRRGPPQRVYFHDSDRVVVRQYLSEHYSYRCPPGLARKHNGCRPPGHIKHYVIGQPLPSYVEYYPVPQPLLVQLQPVPRGYRYVMVDNDVLLMAEASHHIIDAITLLSAAY